MKTHERKDKVGKNTVLSLRYFSGAATLIGYKRYLQMNIHERITVRAFYCGNTYPSLCIKGLIEFNNAA
jgi:hypothetical protein